MDRTRWRFALPAPTHPKFHAQTCPSLANFVIPTTRGCRPHLARYLSNDTKPRPAHHPLSLCLLWVLCYEFQAHLIHAVEAIKAVHVLAKAHMSHRDSSSHSTHTSTHNHGTDSVLCSSSRSKKRSSQPSNAVNILPQS